MALQSLSSFSHFFNFMLLYAINSNPWTVGQYDARPLIKNRITQTQNRRTQTYMSRIGFEPTTSVYERMETIYALDRLATEVGRYVISLPNFALRYGRRLIRY